MDTVIDVLKRVLFAIVMITIANIVLDNIVAYSVFNIAFVAVFTVPGIIVLIFMIYYL
jgi:hypothetical protein